MQLLKQWSESPDPGQSKSHNFQSVVRNWIKFRVLLLGWLISVVVVFLSNPTINLRSFTASVDSYSREYQPARFPENDTQGIIIGVIVQRGFSPKTFDVHADDCIEHLSVNGEAVPLPEQAVCSYPWGFVVNLEKHLRKGRNTLRAIVKNNGGGAAGFSINPSHRDATTFTLRMLSSVLLIFLLIFCSATVGIKSQLAIAFGIGGGLRLYLTLATPYWVRSYDYWSHIDYITHVTNNWSLPVAADGWMFYHPPLYYILTSSLNSVVQFFGASTQSALLGIQLFSCLLSVLTLYYLLKLCAQIFSKSISQRYLGWLLALWPGVVLFAPRINNDLPAQTLSALLVLVVYQSWKNESMKHFLGGAIVAAASILAKTSTLPLVVFAFAAPVVRIGPSVIRQSLLFFLAVLVLVSPYFFSRLNIDGEVLLGGNVENLDSGLELNASWKGLLTVDPVALIEQPFNDSRLDQARRNYFLEYWMKSSLLGEFELEDAFWGFGRFGVIALLFLGFVAAINLAQSILASNTNDKFMMLFLAFGVGTHFFYRLMVPYSCAQDFRYTWYLILPISYFAVRGLEREGIWDIFCRFSIVAFCVASAALLIVAPFSRNEMWG